MLTSPTRPLSFGVLVVALASWSCSSEQSAAEPSAESELSSATAATYTVRDLGTLGGPFSQALGINDAGAIVGSSSLGVFPDTRLRAFVWKSGVMTNLGALAGGLRSEATAINQDGIIVGW